MASSEGGISMLDKMSAEMVAKHVEKAPKRQLSTLPGEQVAPFTPTLPKDLPGQFMSHETLRGAAQNLREQAAKLIAVAEAIDVLTGEHTEAAVEYAVKQAELEQVLREREGDRKAAERSAKAAVPQTVEQAGSVEQPTKAAVAAEVAEEGEAETEEGFDARMARLTEEAKAATFKGEPNPIAVGVAEDMGATLWVCPNHGDTDVKEKVSPKGRHFMRCMVPGCTEFEKK